MTIRKIDVSLDTDVNANPPVVLSTRNEQADDNDTIEWCKKDKNDTWTFASLDPNGNGEPFSPPSISECGTKFTCKYKPPIKTPGKEYAYTLTITEGKNTYTTTTKFNLTDGKPVIRN